MGKKVLYLKYRPKKLKDVLGQDVAIASLLKMHKKGKVPHVLLFTGASGCGKTTIARIMAGMLGCKGGDLSEVNSADFRGIDTIRDIRNRMNFSPMEGETRIWIIDEVHGLTRQAQEAFLKVLEDTPNHVYFFLCTTDPAKLIAAIKTRCTDVKLQSLKDTEIQSLLDDVLDKEKVKIKDEVRDKIIDISAGSARKALVLLHQVIDLDDKKQQLNLLQSSDTEKQAIDLARALMKGASWKEIAVLIKNCTDEPEQIRRLILGYGSACALGGAPRGFLLIDCFSSNYFDSGKAGLIWSCNQVVQAGFKRK
jgi:DNA polymerase-3 subunit gamma/tau